MNIFGIIILIALIVDYLMNYISDRLNISNMNSDLPEEFEGIYSKDEYKKSQEYTKERTKFGHISSSFSLIITLCFWFLGGFDFLDKWVMTLAETEVYRGIIYISVLLIGQSILGLPFSVYSTFVIEEKYGFNKTSLKTFILDMVKGIGLGVIIGLPILAGILYVLGEMGQYAWLYTWIGITVISMLITYIAPTWIMPLFNKFTPLEDGELKDLIMDYARRVDFPLTNLFIIDGSKRSTKSNAFFTGFGKNKKIALYDTLLENQTNNEILAILAHEIGHYKKKHISKSMIISVLHTGVLLFLLQYFLGSKELFEAFFMENMSVYSGLIFFSLLFAPIEMILSVLMNILSRKNEYEADRYAKENGNLEEHLISALKKLSVNNLSNLTPHPFYTFLNYSHPTVLDRINALKQ